MNYYRRPACTALLTLVALVGISACGASSDSATPSTSPSAAATPTVGATPTATPTPSPVKASTTTEAIKVTGEYGKSPTVTFKAPWAINKTQTRVLKPSDGATVKSGQSVEVNYFGVDGRTGKKFDDSYSRGAPAAFNLDQVVPGFKKGLVGQKQGSRVLVAMPGADGYDPSGGKPDAGINVGDSLVFVVDIVGVQLSGPQGAKVESKAGLPTVADKNGVPSISVPKSDPPSALVAQPLIKGEGKKIAATDTITFNYRWVAWKDGRLLEESYSQPAAGSAPLAQLLPGMQKGLVNQTVGSRVLLVIPPADAYPDGNEKPKVAKGETLVMVVDLLFTAAGQ